jgi:hypothetical protein
MVLFAFSGNLLIAYSFRIAPVGIASMSVLATTVVVMIASTLLLLDGPISTRAWLAASAVLGTAA